MKRQGQTTNAVNEKPDGDLSQLTAAKGTSIAHIDSLYDQVASTRATLDNDRCNLVIGSPVENEVVNQFLADLPPHRIQINALGTPEQVRAAYAEAFQNISKEHPLSDAGQQGFLDALDQRSHFLQQLGGTDQVAAFFSVGPPKSNILYFHRHTEIEVGDQIEHPYRLINTFGALPTLYVDEQHVDKMKYAAYEYTVDEVRRSLENPPNIHGLREFTVESNEKKLWKLTTEPDFLKGGGSVEEIPQNSPALLLVDQNSAVHSTPATRFSRNFLAMDTVAIGRDGYTAGELKMAWKKGDYPRL